MKKCFISFEEVKKVNQATLNDNQLRIAVFLMGAGYEGTHSAVSASFIADELGLQGNLSGDLEALVKKGLVKKIKNSSVEYFLFDTSDEQPNIKNFSSVLVSKKTGQVLGEVA